ncbi:MAG: polyprenyl synthetase family protein [Acidimicrobiales bacterium]|nr:polyprenyl synthetase family protein [Acidimicrobiales bacterium]
MLTIASIGLVMESTQVTPIVKQMSVNEIPNENPKAISEIVTPIDKRLIDVIRKEQEQWVSIDPSLIDPFVSLEKLIFSGGKRLRPAFFYWGHIGSGGDPDSPKVIDAAAAIEMLHAFALAHDDVMDRSKSRRGEPSIWQQFANLHTEEQWSGNPVHFGEAVAILVGDLAHVLADKLMVHTSPTVSTLWDELRMEVNIGQYLDVLSGAKGKFDHVAARRILEYKTGRYSVQRPLHIGAAIAGRDNEFHEMFTSYGRPVGVAFQLRDDLLGVFGDPKKTGKPVGDDLREGKPTPLMAEAHSRASKSQIRVLEQVGSLEITSGDIANIQAVVEETGAAGIIENEIKDLTEEALAVLDGMTLEGNADEALRELAIFVAYRTY